MNGTIEYHIGMAKHHLMCILEEYDRCKMVDEIIEDDVVDNVKLCLKIIGDR